MNRCYSLPCLPNTMKSIAARTYYTLAAAGLSFLLLFGSASAFAQSERENPVLDLPPPAASEPGVRRFPANALRGRLVVTQAPQLVIDGKAERLSPGARIRGPQNQLLMASALAGQNLIVNFTRESYGNVHEVWILTADEQRQKLKAATPERNFIFSSEADKPKLDDGKTPFDQLPKYKQ